MTWTIRQQTLKMIRNNPEQSDETCVLEWTAVKRPSWNVLDQIKKKKKNADVKEERNAVLFLFDFLYQFGTSNEDPALAFMLFTAARRKSDTKETKLREAARKIRRKMSSGDNGRVSVVGGNAGCPKPNDLSHHFQLVNFWEISKFLRVAVNCTVQMSEGAVRKKFLICIILIECRVFLYRSIALETLYLKSFDLNFMWPRVRPQKNAKEWWQATISSTETVSRKLLVFLSFLIEFDGNTHFSIALKILFKTPFEQNLIKYKIWPQNHENVPVGHVNPGPTQQLWINYF